jgi:hypothetical protein
LFCFLDNADTALQLNLPEMIKAQLWEDPWNHSQIHRPSNTTYSHHDRRATGASDTAVGSVVTNNRVQHRTKVEELNESILHL